MRPEIEEFEAYSPGLSTEEIKERFGLSQVVKLASNENPIGTSPLVQDTVSRWAGQVFRYPRKGTPELSRRLAAQLNVPDDSLVLGNGSDEIIDLLLRVLGRPGEDNIVVFEPSFSIYRLQARLCGLEVRYVPLNQDFSFPFSEMAKRVDANTRLVFATNPDNPSGYAAPAEEILSFAETLPKSAFLAIDEAYIDFADQPEVLSPLPSLARNEGIGLLRTFSKMYGLAGLRLGYGILPPWLADALQRVKLPFSVNLLAEQAGLAALKDDEFLRHSRETVLRGKALLTAGLERCGCRVYPSQANFLLVRPPQPAEEVHEALLRKGFIVRPLKSYGLPDHLRISIGRDEENASFLQCLEEILA
jgi:histidinol-phosphate aminotransferase